MAFRNLASDGGSDPYSLQLESLDRWTLPMLNAIIRFALHQRLLIVVFSLFLMGFRVW